MSAGDVAARGWLPHGSTPQHQVRGGWSTAAASRMEGHHNSGGDGVGSGVARRTLELLTIPGSIDCTETPTVDSNSITFIGPGPGSLVLVPAVPEGCHRFRYVSTD